MTRPPRPPQVPSGTSKVKTHTRASGLGHLPPSASNQRPGHRLGDASAALLVVLAFGDLADEPVVRRLGRNSDDAIIPLTRCDGDNDSCDHSCCLVRQAHIPICARHVEGLTIRLPGGEET